MDEKWPYRWQGEMDARVTVVEREVSGVRGDISALRTDMHVRHETIRGHIDAAMESLRDRVRKDLADHMLREEAELASLNTWRWRTVGAVALLAWALGIAVAIAGVWLH